MRLPATLSGHQNDPECTKTHRRRLRPSPHASGYLGSATNMFLRNVCRPARIRASYPPTVAESRAHRLLRALDLRCHPPRQRPFPAPDDCNARGPDRLRGDATDNAAAGLGATGVIDDRQLAFADLLFEIPLPGHRVPRFAGRSENAQRREIVLLDPVISLRHQGPNSGGGQSEDVDIVPLGDFPYPIGIRIDRAFLRRSRWWLRAAVRRQ